MTIHNCSRGGIKRPAPNNNTFLRQGGPLSASCYSADVTSATIADLKASLYFGKLKEGARRVGK